MPDRVRDLPMVTIRVTTDEREKLNVAAKLAGLSFQDWAFQTLMLGADRVMARHLEPKRS